MNAIPHAPLRTERLRVHAARGEPLDLRCEGGSVTVITGASAHETSAWLETLALLRAPCEGRVHLLDCSGGEDERARIALRRRVGYADVNSPLVSSMNVRMNVMLPLLYHHSARHDDARQAADRALEHFDYDAPGNAAPARLSALNSLRALLARAIALDPAIVFIDEPFRISVAASWSAIGAQIESLAREDGRTVLVATRNLSFAAASADQVVFIEHGCAGAYAGWHAFARAERPAAFIAALPFASTAPEHVHDA